MGWGFGQAIFQYKTASSCGVLGELVNEGSVMKEYHLHWHLKLCYPRGKGRCKGFEIGGEHINTKKWFKFIWMKTTEEIIMDSPISNVTVHHIHISSLFIFPGLDHSYNKDINVDISLSWAAITMSQASPDAYREGHSGGSICTAECWSPRCLASCLQIAKEPVKMKLASYYFGQMSSYSC